MKTEIIDIGAGEAGLIKPLWEELNAIHLRDSVHWKERYESFTFDRRMAFLADIPEANIKLSTVQSEGAVLGYCLSTAKEAVGEIESLYLDPSIRGRQIGETLVREHIAWLKSRGCQSVKVTVAHGHDSVIPFYNKQGFFERRIELELK